jgi:signal transduction histidine kinase
MSEYPAELSISIIRDDQGTATGFVTIVRDLTERKQIQQRLVKSERFAAIGELAGMIGHDLRNPLTGIKNAAYYLKRKQGNLDPEKAVEMTMVIDRSVDHANAIINDLLDYSRDIHLELEESTPTSLFAVALASIQIPERIKIVNKSTDEPTMLLDLDKIERVFVNIIKNAVDAIPENGTLELTNRQGEEEVEFIFRDTGTGMSEQTIARIFTPLFTTKAKGMGFGLAICKRIVEAHNGKIKVESAVGKGTTFTVTLPIEQEPNSDDAPEWIFPERVS